jgi:uncharacterized membrane protein
MHRRRFTISDSQSAWWAIGTAAVYVALVVVIVTNVAHWNAPGVGRSITGVAVAGLWAAAAVVCAVPTLVVVGIPVHWVLNQLHRLLMGAYEPSYQEAERLREQAEHDELDPDPTCPTCGQTLGYKLALWMRLGLLGPGAVSSDGGDSQPPD